MQDFPALTTYPAHEFWDLIAVFVLTLIHAERPRICLLHCTECRSIPAQRQQTCAHLLTVDMLHATCKSMEMARDRKPVNLSLDPDLVEQLRSWCKAQDVEVALARAVDKAISEFLEKRGDGDGSQ